MVIGNGMVAKKFESYKSNDKIILFASGVSNSKSTIEEAYKREISLLRDTIAINNKHILVYFSTGSIYDPGEKKSRYILHKKEVEKIIQSECSRYYIFRVSNLAGKSSNPNTVLNFFVFHILHGINFDLWKNATRNLIDIDDMYKIVDYILKKSIYQNQIINIANPENYTTEEIISTIETLWKTRASYISIPKGHSFNIDISLITPIMEELGIHFEKNYLINLLRKYYYHP
ncbi:MAG: NAD-dependent epimerase/dehydratase family protein [Chitinophagales bacterium]